MGKLLSKTRRRRGRNMYGRDKPNTEVSASYESLGPNSSAVSAIHSDAVVTLAPVQLGFCLSGSKDKSVVLYDYTNARLEDRWTGHEKEVTKVRYGSGCYGIFSASRDKSIKMWRRGNPHVMQNFLGHELVVTAIDLNEDNTQLCSGSRDNSVRLWDVEQGSCISQHTLAQNLVTDVKWIPQSSLIVQTGEDKEVRLYDTRCMEIVHSFPRKQYIQMCCDVSLDGSYCVTCSNGFGGNGCEATLWDLKALKPVHEYSGHREALESCIFVPTQDRPLIATSSRDCSVRIWDRDSKACVCDIIIDGSGPLSSLLAYQDGSICVASFKRGIFLLELLETNDVHNYSLRVKSQF